MYLVNVNIISILIHKKVRLILLNLAIYLYNTTMIKVNCSKIFRLGNTKCIHSKRNNMNFNACIPIYVL